MNYIRTFYYLCPLTSKFFSQQCEGNTCGVYAAPAYMDGWLIVTFTNYRYNSLLLIALNKMLLCTFYSLAMSWWRRHRVWCTHKNLHLTKLIINAERSIIFNLINWCEYINGYIFICLLLYMGEIVYAIYFSTLVRKLII